MNPTSAPFLILLLATAGALPAQKVPLPDGSGRQLQLFDLARLERAVPGDADPAAAAPAPAAAAPAPAAPAPAAPAAPAEPVMQFGGGPAAGQLDPADAARADAERAHAERATAAAALATQLVRFVEPPLGLGDDCRVLGGRWLALLASPEQIASLERLLQFGLAQRQRQIDVEIRLLSAAAAPFTAELLPWLDRVQRGDQVSFEAVIAPEDVGRFTAAVEAAKPRVVQAPRLRVAPLHVATLANVEQTSFLEDFTLRCENDAVVAEPRIGTVWDGSRTEVFAAPMPDGTLGISCSVTVQDVEQPIATFETKAPGGAVPLTIQLPRVHGTQLQQTAVVAPGSLVVVAARKLDGSWLVAQVRASLAGE